MTRQLTLLAMATALTAAATQPAVEWTTLGNVPAQGSEPASYTQRITYTPADGVVLDRICFNMFARPMRALNPQDTIVEIIPGYYAVTGPRIRQAHGPVDIDLWTKGTLRKTCYKPDGFHGVTPDGLTVPMTQQRHLLTEDAKMYTLPGDNISPSAQELYDLNASLQSDWTPGLYDIIPSYKKVNVTAGSKPVPVRSIKTLIAAGDHDDQVLIDIDAIGNVIIAAPDTLTARMARRRFETKVLGPSRGLVQQAYIEDWPSYEYRGQMIDIARNFQPLSELLKIVDEMALQGLNTLHLHLADDEAWRVEMPSFPELTDMASHRGYTLDDADFLAQTYTGDGNPYSTGGTANGYYTTQDFITLLQYAADRGIRVIPEVDVPGHSRAAIKAMEQRWRRTGDDTYRLVEDGDQSKYDSAQDYRDNVMNPALDGPYRFVQQVLEDLIGMYRQAGAPLVAFNIGGDEVPNGAWNGSPSMPEFMNTHGLADQTAVHGYFVRRIDDMIAHHGLPIAGWQEMAYDNSQAFDTKMLPRIYGIQAWRTMGKRNLEYVQNILDRGYPVIMYNCDRNYMDMAYSPHPEENGLTWARPVDELQSLGGYAEDYFTFGPDTKGRILGVAGALWAETLRSPQQMQEYLLPKFLGMAERAWNADSTYTPQQFLRVIDLKERPRWEAQGLNYHMRQPGITLLGGKILMNAPTQGVIRYTLDGTDPTATSAVYDGPVTLPRGVKEIRARLYNPEGTRHGQVTILPLD